MLFFRQNKFKVSQLEVLVQVFCLLAMLSDAWIRWHYQIDPEQMALWSATKIGLNTDRIKNLNWVSVLHNLNTLIKWIPAQIEIHQLIFLVGEWRLIGFSDTPQTFTQFCERLRQVSGLKQFQILTWQEQTRGPQVRYRFVMVWR